MKVAISVNGSGLGCQLEPRFGRADQFLIVETDHGQCELFDNTGNCGTPTRVPGSRPASGYSTWVSPP